MIAIHKTGWPVEMIKGRHITNFIRFILHADVVETLKNCFNKNYVISLNVDTYNERDSGSDEVQYFSNK